MLNMLALFILSLVFIVLLPYIVLVVIGIVALLLKFAWLPVVVAGLLWLLSVIDNK